MAGNAGRTRTHQAGIPARASASAAAMSVPEVFQRIIAALNQAGIPYMLSGSFASAYYRAPRSTHDIDLVIEATPTQLRAFVQGLRSNEYYVVLAAVLEAQKRQSLFNLIDVASGWRLDLVSRKSRNICCSADPGQTLATASEWLRLRGRCLGLTAVRRSRRWQTSRRACTECQPG